MPDQWNFDHLPNWGVITYACIERGCEARGKSYEWPEEKRAEHYRMHNPEKVDDSDFLADLPTMALKVY